MPYETTNTKPKVLIVSQQSTLCQITKAYFEFLGANKLDICGAFVEADDFHMLAIEIMNEVGIDISTSKEVILSELRGQTFNIVITIGKRIKEFFKSFVSDEVLAEPSEKSPIFSGLPMLIHWDLEEISPNGKKELGEELRSARDMLKKNVESLLNSEFLEASYGQHTRWTKLIDALEDGILAHDNSRRIFLFNKAAERITGYKREEVFGLDCHWLFSPHGLCGAQCKFCDKQVQFTEEKAECEISFTSKDGVDKRLKMNVSPLGMDVEKNWGVIAEIRDVTEVKDLRRRLQKERSFHGMVGHSAAMQDVFDALRPISSSDYPVLITGESGTGKELLANAIHNESRRKEGPFVPINCGALPDNILESELFGHVRGAFTGAIRNKKGRFELAHKGTLFLDEVGELSPSFQVKLLRVLQEKRFEMVGGEQTIEVDVRVISATNRDLRTITREGRFREDLFYRLCVVPVELPPLRKRREDIPMLVEHTLKRIREQTDSKITSIAPQTMDCLLRYQWPGNVRELINSLQFASVVCKGDEILPEHLPIEIRQTSSDLPKKQKTTISQAVDSNKKSKLDIDAVKQALALAGNNRVKAAKILGVGRATLYRFLKDNSL